MFDPALTDVTWSTTAFDGAQARDGGSGDIHEALDLPAGASVTFTVTATLSARPATGVLANTSSIALPAGLTDSEPADNTATAKLQVIDNPALKPLHLDAILAQEATTGKTLRVQPHVVDLNLPNGQIIFSLDPGAPAGATVDPETGVFTWTPSGAQTSATVTIRASDFGDPALSATATFSIRVIGANPRPIVTIPLFPPLVVGTLLGAVGSVTNSGPGPFLAVVDYGDGSGFQPLAVPPTGHFRLAHVYNRPGQYQVTVDVADSAGALGQSTQTVMVSPSPPSGFGAARDAFVTTLYSEDLGRFPEPSGLRFWSGVLAAGVRPRTVAAAIFHSPAHRVLVVQGLIAPLSFRESYADALFAGRQAARRANRLLDTLSRRPLAGS